MRQLTHMRRADDGSLGLFWPFGRLSHRARNRDTREALSGQEKHVQAGAVRMVCAAAFAAVCVAAGSAAMAQETSAMRNVSVAEASVFQAQRVAMAACMVMAGIEPRTHASIVKDAVGSLDRWNASLAVTADITNTPETPHAIWQDLRPAVLQLAAGDFHAVAMRQFLLLRDPFVDALGTSGGAVQGDAAARDKAATLRLAASLRGLAQRATHDLCMIAVDVDVATSVAALARTVDVIDDIFVKLDEGDAAAGILGLPTSEIEDQIWILQGDWEDLSETYRAAVAGSAASRADLAHASERTVVLMGGLNEIVRLYAAL